MGSASHTASGETCAAKHDKTVIEWIRSAAIPLATVEPRQGYADLEALRPVIGNARILSLGEATHGTREFFKLKHRLLEFCVAELGFTMLGIEAGFPESLAVNAYVLNGAGDAADVLAGMRYWVWDTEELIDVVEWMRWWNERNVRKVKFYGFVTTPPTVAALGLIDFLARVEPALAAVCRTELAPLTSDFTENSFRQLSDTRRKTVFACIVRVIAAFAQHRPQWIAATGIMDWHLGRLNASVLHQATRFAAEPSTANHDRAMAENVRALLEAEGADAKAVLWSHNAHAQRATWSPDSSSMGIYLEEMVGRAQVVVGFSFDRGSFQARAYPSGELTDHNVTAADPNSFDAVLAQAGLPLFVLDLISAPRDGIVGAWLAAEIPMRKIGGIYGLPADNKFGATYTDVIVPRKYFDAVLFVAETTAARRNRPSSSPNMVVLAAPANLELAGDGVPTGWQAMGTQRGYVHVASGEPSPRGGRTVRLSGDARTWRWADGQLVQKISAEGWQGKRLRFSAAVRTMGNGVGTGALLFLRFLPQSDGDESDFFVTPLVTHASSVQPVQSPQWTTLAVEADVPAAADLLIIGLAITGRGAAWFGDIECTAATHRD
jgi:erythromycin esterase